MSGGGNIKVVVRCRPLNSRELARGATCLIRMEGNQTIISKPPDHKGNSRDTEDIKSFTFDKSYWSADKTDANYANQAMVYNDLGEDLLNHAFDGYNCCIFAYGQTGAGKSYSMMGYGEDKGIIPLTCCELFNRISENHDSNLTYRVEVSYIEIYNEKVRDLLNPKNKGNLKVREHPSLGPYVEDLSRLAVTCFDDINHLMDEGNKARTVAATQMNETSSRSHAVFTLFLTQTRLDEITKLETEKVARISLVDLAGSERANSTGATGARLKEGANINRSLTTLGKVISGLADQSIQEASKKPGKKQKEIFIPYRDSVLTWLLKDSLGGNSKTAMIAAISPADYDETLSTLRYADQAKKIQNKAVVNEDPNAKLIRELKDELSNLRDRLRVYAPEVVEELASQSAFKPESSTSEVGSRTPVPTRSTISNANQILEFKDHSGSIKKMTRQEIVEQFTSSEKLLANLNETWEEKLKKTEEIHLERENALKELGIMTDKNDMGIYMPKSIPFIVNLNEDPLMSECLMYQIKVGKTRVGRLESEASCEIRLSGSNIQDEHCWFEFGQDNTVTLHPAHKDALTMVNGIRITEPRRLKNGYRIILGHHHIFRFNHPEEVRRERSDLLKLNTPVSPVISEDDDTNITPADLNGRGSMANSETMDWNYARLEAIRNHYSSEADFKGLKDEEIEKLYDDIGRIRNSRKTTRAESRADFIDDDESTSSSINRLSIAATMVDDGSVYTDTTLQSPLPTNEKYHEKIKDVQEKYKKELDIQRSFYEAKINRMSSMHAAGNYQPISMYTPHQLKLIENVLKRWKRLHHVSMAEVVLTNAVTLKEANIISRELNKQVIYQFTIIEEDYTNLKSQWEETSNLDQFNQDIDDNENDTSLLNSPKPCIGIRVIDHKNQSIYVWSLEKFKERLHKMRNLRNFKDRPQYRKHLNWDDPFHEIPNPKYSFIGSAAVSVRNLTGKQQAYESFVEILCRTTGQVKGKLRVLISPIARSGTLTTYLTDEPLDINDDGMTEKKIKEEEDTIQIGQQLLFEIRLLELVGLNENEYTQVHVQYRLSSFGGVSPNSSAEKLFATNSANTMNSTISLDFSQTLSILVTEKTKDILLHKMIAFEVYGIAQPKVLSAIERWDDQREKPKLSDMLAQQNHSNSGSQSNNLKLYSVPSERRPEEEYLSTERHDILAWIQILELMPNGEYLPVQVVSQNPLDKGAFHLKQGLQRRISITLSHTSGRQLMWSKISKATIGQVRLLDSKGRIINAPKHEDVIIRLLSQQQVQYNNDGSSVLVAQGAWDSSQHDCLFLNRLTASQTRILLNLKWETNVEKCSKPIQCNMDIAIRIQGRDASNFGFRKLLLGSQKYLNKYSGVFLIQLRPPMTRRVSQLWRLNTATHPLEGEESLGSWKPRGVSLINDYKHIQERIHRKQQVTVISQAITLHNARSQTSQGSITNNELRENSDTRNADLIRKVLGLWKNKSGANKEIILSQDPPIPGMQDLKQIEREAWNSCNLISEVKLISEFAAISKRGHLNYQENALDDKWVKRWFVLRRPYIHIYTNQSETEEQGVINLSNARIDYNRALESMLNRNNVFSLYTNNNAFILQANSKMDMNDWMKNIDSSYSIEQTTRK